MQLCKPTEGRTKKTKCGGVISHGVTTHLQTSNLLSQPHLQVSQEAGQSQPTLLGLPVPVRPDVLESGIGEHTIVVLWDGGDISKYKGHK